MKKTFLHKVTITGTMKFEIIEIILESNQLRQDVWDNRLTVSMAQISAMLISQIHSGALVGLMGIRLTAFSHRPHE